MKTATLYVLVCAVLSITACQSKPVLKQVDSDAVAKPINTPETAQKLKSQYEK